MNPTLFPAPILALAEGEAASGWSSMWIPFAGMMLIFYFVMFRPQAKERKRRDAMLKAMKKGDKVLLTCGLYGTIAALSEQEVTVKVDDDMRLRFLRSAVQSVLNAENAPERAPAPK